MTRYRVAVDEVHVYEVFVEADSEDEAAVKAEKMVDAPDFDAEAHLFAVNPANAADIEEAPE